MGVRKGQGYNVPKPKRLRCPECAKKGVKQWYVTPRGIFRDCQYCCHTWGELSWAIARAKAEPTGPYGWHCELVHDETGEVIRDIFTRTEPLEGPDKVKGFAWHATAVAALSRTKGGAS